MRPALTVSDYQQLANSVGMVWIGGRIPAGKKPSLGKTRWMCKNKHVWYARYADLYMGRTCPVCNNHEVKTPEHYFALAEAKNIELVGPVPKDTHTPTVWRHKCWDGGGNGWYFLTSFRNLEGQAGPPKGLPVGKEDLPALLAKIPTKGSKRRIPKTLMARLRKKANPYRIVGTGRPVGRPRKHPESS